MLYNILLHLVAIQIKSYCNDSKIKFVPSIKYQNLMYKDNENYPIYLKYELRQVIKDRLGGIEFGACQAESFV